jgi:hypothetical protein
MAQCHGLYSNLLIMETKILESVQDMVLFNNQLNEITVAEAHGARYNVLFEHIVCEKRVLRVATPSFL